MYDFWLSPVISHPTGNKPDIKRERLGPNIYASHMAQVIEKTQTDVYIDFVAKYPDIKIGQRTFDKLKPFFVRPVSEKIGTHVFVDTTLSQIFSSNRV